MVLKKTNDVFESVCGKDQPESHVKDEEASGGGMTVEEAVN